MYLHVFPNWHKLLAVKEVGKRPVRAVLLRTGEDVQFEYKDNTLTVRIPPYKRTRQVDTVKVYLE